MAGRPAFGWHLLWNANDIHLGRASVLTQV
jgi:hypothetical protein